MLKLNEKQKRMFLMVALMAVCFVASPETMLANASAKKEFLEKFTTFESLFTSVVSSLGSIYTLWCISEWGLAWHESNGTMGGQSFKRIFGGIVVVMSPQILAVLG